MSIKEHRADDAMILEALEQSCKNLRGALRRARGVIKSAGRAALAQHKVDEEVAAINKAIVDSGGSV